jgi:hypothetical protein
VANLVLISRPKAQKSGSVAEPGPQPSDAANTYVFEKPLYSLWALADGSGNVPGRATYRTVDAGERLSISRCLLLLDNQAVFYKLVVTVAAFFAILHAWISHPATGRFTPRLAPDSAGAASGVVSHDHVGQLC